MASLADQIKAYEATLPQLKAEHGSKWAVLVDCTFKGAFDGYEQASHFARESFPSGGYLIRHMDEEPVTAPFLTLRG